MTGRLTLNKECDSDKLIIKGDVKVWKEGDVVVLFGDDCCALYHYLQIKMYIFKTNADRTYRTTSKQKVHRNV